MVTSILGAHVLAPPAVIEKNEEAKDTSTRGRDELPLPPLQLPDQPMWEWNGGRSGWVPFDESINTQIESAYNAYLREGGQEAVDVVIRKRPYRMDFVHMAQNNLTTNRDRDIRRSIRPTYSSSNLMASNRSSASKSPAPTSVRDGARDTNRTRSPNPERPSSSSRQDPSGDAARDSARPTSSSRPALLSKNTGLPTEHDSPEKSSSRPRPQQSSNRLGVSDQGPRGRDRNDRPDRPRPRTKDKENGMAKRRPHRTGTTDDGRRRRKRHDNSGLNNQRTV